MFWVDHCNVVLKGKRLLSIILVALVCHLLIDIDAIVLKPNLEIWKWIMQAIQSYIMLYITSNVDWCRSQLSLWYTSHIFHFMISSNAREGDLICLLNSSRHLNFNGAWWIVDLRTNTKRHVVQTWMTTCSKFVISLRGGNLCNQVEASWQSPLKLYINSQRATNSLRLNLDLPSTSTNQPKCTVCIPELHLIHREVTPLSSWEPCANKKNLLFLSCTTKMGQNFINFFSWVDIHGIYYMVKVDNQMWWSFVSRKHTVSN